jgi:hypothetical protein
MWARRRSSEQTGRSKNGRVGAVEVLMRVVLERNRFKLEGLGGGANESLGGPTPL